MFYSLIRQNKVDKPKLESGAGNPPSHVPKTPGVWESHFKWEVILCFHTSNLPRRWNSIHKVTLLQKLIDSTETKREAVFLSVFRKEITAN